VRCAINREGFGANPHHPELDDVVVETIEPAADFFGDLGAELA